MKFFLVAALPALVAAQNYGPPPDPASSSPSSTAPAAAATPSVLPGQHLVIVGGNNTLTFSPNVIVAAVNETVIFSFNSFGGTVQHGVVQSNFTNPCDMLPGGFSSGLQPTSSTFSITITNASIPLWFFCPQTNPAKHCNKAMVGVINPQAGTHSIADFAAEATTANEPVAVTATALTGVGAFASAPPGISSAASGAAPSTTNASGASRLIAGAASLLAGLFTVVYTLA